MASTERVEVPRPLRHCAVHEQYTEGCAACHDVDSASAARIHEWEKSEALKTAEAARRAARIREWEKYAALKAEEAARCGALRKAAEAPGAGDSPAGFKLDGAKNRLELVPPEVIEAIGLVLTAGLAKYPPDNWKHVPGGPRRYAGALLRHLCAAMRGEELDPDSGFPHVFHVAANAAFLVWYQVNGYVPEEEGA